MVIHSDSRINNNGLFIAGDGFVGPTMRNLDEAVGSTNGYFDNSVPARAPRSRTLPGELNPNISILQELDAE